MFETKQKLEISRTEIELIEKALQTQSKILRVEAGAGGAEATDRLNEIKRVLAKITAQRGDRSPRRQRSGGFAGLLRMMGKPAETSGLASERDSAQSLRYGSHG